MSSTHVQNKPNWFHNNNSELPYDNKNKFFCVKSRCLCCAIALQFPQRVVPFLVFFFIVSKPELFYWKLCRLVSEETAVFTPYTVICITVTASFAAHELVIPHAHLPLPGDAPPQYVILLESRDTHHPLPLLNSFALKHSYLINCSQCEAILVRWFTWDSLAPL